MRISTNKIRLKLNKRFTEDHTVIRHKNKHQHRANHHACSLIRVSKFEFCKVGQQVISGTNLVCMFSNLEVCLFEM